MVTKYQVIIDLATLEMWLTLLDRGAMQEVKRRIRAKIVEKEEE